MRTAIACLFALLIAAPVVHAEEEEEMKSGELHVTLDVEYCRVSVNGQKWDEVEFERGGKVALIKNLVIAQPNSVTLTPFSDQREPVTVEIGHDDFKKTRIGKLYYMIATKKVAFPKRKGAVKPPPVEKPSEPAKKPQPDEEEDEL